MSKSNLDAASCGEMDFDGVAAELDRGNRVLLMVRHAERPKMDRNDPTFGEQLPLTAAGCAMSRTFGERWRAYAQDVQFISSPLLRTRMTAACIAEGMGLSGTPIPTDPILGNSTPYFASQHAVFEFFRDGGFFQKCFTYFRTGHQVGFADLQVATDQLEAWCAAHFTARLGIFTTHDLYNCAFLSARGVVPVFTEANWTRFLDSAAIIFTPLGERRYALVRAHLSEGITGVAP